MRTPLLLLAFLSFSAVATAFEGLPDDSLSGNRLLSDDEAAEAMVETADLSLPSLRDDRGRAPEPDQLLPVQERLRLAEAARPVPRLRVNGTR